MTRARVAAVAVLVTLAAVGAWAQGLESGTAAPQAAPAEPGTGAPAAPARAAAVTGTWRGFRSIGGMTLHHRIAVPADGARDAEGVCWFGMTEEQADAALRDQLDPDPLTMPYGPAFCVAQRYRVSCEGGVVELRSRGVERLVAVLFAKGARPDGHGVILAQPAPGKAEACVAAMMPGQPMVMMLGPENSELNWHAFAHYRPDVFRARLTTPGLLASDAAKPEEGGMPMYGIPPAPGIFRLAKDGALTSPRLLTLPRGKTTKATCLPGDKYHYVVYVPKSYDPRKPAPLLVNSSPGGNAKPLSIAMAEKLGWIMVGLTESRNGPWPPICLNRDAALFDVRRRLSIDPKRVYFSGFSGGSRASLWAAANHPESCAGVLCIGAGLPNFATPPARKVSVCFLAGKTDFNRGEVTRLHEQEGAAGRRSRLVLFAGGHQWAPQKEIDAAIAWLAQK